MKYVHIDLNEMLPDGYFYAIYKSDVALRKGAVPDNYIEPRIFKTLFDAHQYILNRYSYAEPIIEATRSSGGYIDKDNIEHELWFYIYQVTSK